MRFELVQARLGTMPRELPAPPAVLMPIRLDGADFVPPAARRQGRPAAVLVLLFPDDERQTRVLLTARVPHLSSHPGEVSFPGGSADPDDESPVATALRESREEVGLDPDACGLRVVGALERVTIPVSGFRITPVVALADRRPALVPAPDEVARIVEAPVEAFLPDAPVELEERVIRERLVRYGMYPVAGERVWGATARMLGQLGALLAGEPSAAGAGADGGEDASPQPLPGELPRVRSATAADAAPIRAFLEALAPELARDLPAASELLVAEARGSVVGVAAWAPWDRPRPDDEPRGFGDIDFPGETPGELTLLAVAPAARGQGLGRRLTTSIAEAARTAGCERLLAWTLADTAVHPSSAATRAFFRANGFADLAVDRRFLARGEERLLLSRALPDPER